MKKRIYDRIGETVYEETLENGLHVFVFPKPEFGKFYAFFATLNAIFFNILYIFFLIAPISREIYNPNI